MGDIRWSIKEPRKILQVIPYAGAVPFRYILESIPNVSYTESQLLLAKEEKESKFVVKKIIGERTNKKVVEYLVWWDKYLKKDSTWEPKTKLMEDIGEEALNSFVKEFRDSKK